jgi:hypothetical protein
MNTAAARALPPLAAAEPPQQRTNSLQQSPSNAEGRFSPYLPQGCLARTSPQQQQSGQRAFGSLPWATQSAAWGKAGAAPCSKQHQRPIAGFAPERGGGWDQRQQRKQHPPRSQSAVGFTPERRVGAPLAPAAGRQPGSLARPPPLPGSRSLTGSPVLLPPVLPGAGPSPLLQHRGRGQAPQQCMRPPAALAKQRQPPPPVKSKPRSVGMKKL